MTHLQITAIHVSDGDGVPWCCQGLIQSVRIGPAQLAPASAAEIKADLRSGRERYFAMIDGDYLDVIVRDCATCGAPFLATPHGVESLHRLAAVAM